MKTLLFLLALSVSQAHAYEPTYNDKLADQERLQREHEDRLEQIQRDSEQRQQSRDADRRMRERPKVCD